MNKVILTTASGYKDKELKPAIEKVFSMAGHCCQNLYAKKVFVKPNLLAASPPHFLDCTHPQFIKVVLEILLDIGAKPFISDIPVLGTLKQVSKKAGLDNICAKLGVPIIPSKKMTTVISPEGFEDIRLPPLSSLAFECDALINLPKWKAHNQLCLTLAVKNLFGCVKLSKRIHLHQKSEIDEFARMLLAISRAVNPTLNILDGVIAMETSGPRGGTERKIGVIMAGRDPIRVDFSAARLIDAPLNEVPVLRMAMKTKLEGSNPEDTAFEGENFDSLICKGFIFPPHNNLAFHPIRSAKILLRKLFKKISL